MLRFVKADNQKPVKIIWDFTYNILSIENDAIIPEEIVVHKTRYIEGARKQVYVNAYERDLNARKKCIDYHGCICSVCGFDFSKVYGILGEGFIVVHHLIPISNIGEEYEVNPIDDLRPVCSNCHAMIHRKKSLLSIEELRILMS
jgi:predicted HNH restriction endonuclease